ncbi:MAG: hypothetical protein ACPG7F_07460, partial [Aggregatilineales bacterium]
MLTPIEKMLFLMLVLLSLGAAYTGFMDVYNVINRGQGNLRFNLKKFVAQIGQRANPTKDDPQEDGDPVDIPEKAG